VKRRPRPSPSLATSENISAARSSVDYVVVRKFVYSIHTKKNFQTTSTRSSTLTGEGKLFHESIYRFCLVIILSLSRRALDNIIHTKNHLGCFRSTQKNLQLGLEGLHDTKFLDVSNGTLVHYSTHMLTFLAHAQHEAVEEPWQRQSCLSCTTVLIKSYVIVILHNWRRYWSTPVDTYSSR
jgi:hypothetical protein